MQKICLVIPFSFSFDSWWITYSIPKWLSPKIWSIVEISLKQKSELAIVIALWEKDTSEEKYEIKDIVWVKESIVLRKKELLLFHWISQEYFSPTHASAQLFLQKHLLENIKKDKIKFTPLEKMDTIYPPIQLSKAQEKIFQQLLESKEKNILFWGLTGSGKTEIYIQLTKKMLELWKQTLILTPEIILGNQVAARFKQVFWPENITEINSSIPEAKKTKSWLNIYSWNAKIIIGTRSSIFYPYKELWLIIMDEEHDKSYISDNWPRYNSREVLEYISSISDTKVIFASGTPSIKSMLKAQRGEYSLINLLEKYEQK